MAVLIPDEKCLVRLIKKIFWPVQYTAGYHPGPVAPPRTDGDSLTDTVQAPPCRSFNSAATIFSIQPVPTTHRAELKMALEENKTH